MLHLTKLSFALKKMNDAIYDKKGQCMVEPVSNLNMRNEIFQLQRHHNQCLSLAMYSSGKTLASTLISQDHYNARLAVDGQLQIRKHFLFK